MSRCVVVIIDLSLLFSRFHTNYVILSELWHLESRSSCRSVHSAAERLSQSYFTGARLRLSCFPHYRFISFSSGLDVHHSCIAKMSGMQACKGETQICLPPSTRLVQTFLLCHYMGVETLSLSDVRVSWVPTVSLHQPSDVHKSTPVTREFKVLHATFWCNTTSIIT